MSSTDHATLLYLQTLALTSPTSGGRSVSIVRQRTKATEIVSLRSPRGLSSNILYVVLVSPISHTVNPSEHPEPNQFELLAHVAVWSSARFSMISCLAYSSTLSMEATYCSKTLADFHKTSVKGNVFMTTAARTYPTSQMCNSLTNEHNSRRIFVTRCQLPECKF
jgi:hypothetical protein